MGIPIDPPPVPGDDCDTCTPELFLPDETPLYVHVVFTDVTICPGPWGKLPIDCVLKQSEFFPCHWEINTDEFACIYWLTPAASILKFVWHESPDGFRAFDGAGGVCVIIISNDKIAADCAHTATAFGGYATITLS